MRQLISLALLIAATALSADWPQFRGPNGLGVSAERNLLQILGHLRRPGAPLQQRLERSHVVASPLNGPPGNITGSALNAWLPQAKISSSDYLYIWSQNSVNHYGLAGVTTIGNPGFIIANPDLSVQQAFAIDTKMDDGFPQSGSVTAQYSTSGILSAIWADTNFHDAGPYTTATAGSASTCYDNNNAAGTQQQYSMKQNGGAGRNCALSFQFQ